MIGYNKGIIK